MMDQSLATDAKTSSSLPVSKSLIYFQLVSQAVVFVDLFIRCISRWKAISYVHDQKEGVRIGLDDVFPFVAFVSVEFPVKAERN